MIDYIVVGAVAGAIGLGCGLLVGRKERRAQEVRVREAERLARNSVDTMVFIENEILMMAERLNNLEKHYGVAPTAFGAVLNTKGLRG